MACSSQSVFIFFLVLIFNTLCPTVVFTSLHNAHSDYHTHHKRHQQRESHSNDDSMIPQGQWVDNNVSQAIAALQAAVEKVQRNVINKTSSDDFSKYDITTEALSSLEAAVHTVQQTFKDAKSDKFKNRYLDKRSKSKDKADGPGSMPSNPKPILFEAGSSSTAFPDATDYENDQEIRDNANGSHHGSLRDQSSRHPPIPDVEHLRRVRHPAASRTDRQSTATRGHDNKNVDNTDKMGQLQHEAHSVPAEVKVNNFGSALDVTKRKTDTDSSTAQIVNAPGQYQQNDTKTNDSLYTQASESLDTKTYENLKTQTMTASYVDGRLEIKAIALKEAQNTYHSINALTDTTQSHEQTSETVTETTAAATVDYGDDDDDTVSNGLSWFSWSRKKTAATVVNSPKQIQKEFSDNKINTENNDSNQATISMSNSTVSHASVSSTESVPIDKNLKNADNDKSDRNPAPEFLDYEDPFEEEDVHPHKNTHTDVSENANTFNNEGINSTKVHEGEGHDNKETPEGTQIRTESVGKYEKCPGCHKLASSLLEARELHKQVLRAQLLDKLQLVPTFRKRPSRPKLPDQVFPQGDHSDYAHDNYYAKPTSLLIFGRDLGPRTRLRKPGTGSYQFGLTGKVKGSVTSADLWVYKMKDAHDVHGQTLLVTDLQLSKSESLHEKSLVARLETHLEEGWLRFDVTRLVQRWLKGKTPDSQHLLAIRCKTCHRTKYRAIFGAKSHFRPVLMLQVGQWDESEGAEDGEGRSLRKKRNACDPNSSCCLFELTVHFHDLDINAIFHPPSIRANYCYGTCDRPDASYYSHTEIVQRMRYGTATMSQVNETLRERLKPCCVPVVLREASIMHYINDGLDTQVSVVPNLLVQKCGCA